MPVTEVTVDDITIDPEFSKLLRPLTDDERAALLVSIEREGRYREKLIVWKDFNILVDGHHRLDIYQTCHEGAEITAPDIEEMFFPSREAVKQWILGNQLARRNLNDFQRTEIALQREQSFKTAAKEKQRAAGGALPKNSAEAPIETRQEVAKAAGVSHDTVRKVKDVIEHAPPETVEAARKGDISVHKAHQSLATVKPPKAKPEPTAREPVYGPGVLPKSFAELVEKIVKKWPSEKLRDFGEQVRDVCKLAVEKERKRRGQ